MVSAKLFDSVPPFPEDVPLAQLSSISLNRLSAGKQDEVDSMFKACQESGFFVLDLNGDALGEKMITELSEIFEIIKATMHVSEEEKVKYQAKPPAKFTG